MIKPWGDRKGRADVTAAPCSPSPVPSGVWGSSESTQLRRGEPGDLPQAPKHKTVQKLLEKMRLLHEKHLLVLSALVPR